MEQVSLENHTEKNEKLSATFLPHLGMNLASFTKDGHEVIDQNTKQAFSQRFAGLGPIIGPHFFRMDEDLVVKPLPQKLFPHIQEFIKRGQKDPFSHGIARYVPWNYLQKGSCVQAHLSGSDQFQGVYLKDLEGYDFSMTFQASLEPDGLAIAMSVSGERECVCGLHYYYALEAQKGIITSPIQNQYNENGFFKKIPSSWLNKDDNFLRFDVEKFADYGFLPLFNNASSWVLLETGTKKLRVSYQGEPEKVSCQIYSPKDASFVCIEPISAKNPRNLDQSESKFSAKISIL